MFVASIGGKTFWDGLDSVVARGAQFFNCYNYLIATSFNATVNARVNAGHNLTDKGRKV